MFVVVYNKVDREGGDSPSRFAGEILRVVKVNPNDDFALTAQEQILDETEDYIFHDADNVDDDFDRSFKVEAGSLVEREHKYSQDELRILVNKEREKRLKAGAIIDGVKVSGTERDILNLNSIAMAAQVKIAAGVTTPSVFRDDDNVIHELSPTKMLEIWMRALAIVEKIYTSSWSLKDGEQIPQDYSNDTYWSIGENNG